MSYNVRDFDLYNWSENKNSKQKIFQTIKDKRVQTVSVANSPLDLDKMYKICACERDGDPSDMLCRMRNVANAANTQYTLHSVMREYLSANSPVTPTPPENADILDAPQTLLTQVTGVDYQFH